MPTCRDLSFSHSWKRRHLNSSHQWTQHWLESASQTPLNTLVHRASWLPFRNLLSPNPFPLSSPRWYLSPQFSHHVWLGNGSWANIHESIREAPGSLESTPESCLLVYFVNCVLHSLYISLANKHICPYTHLLGEPIDNRGLCVICYYMISAHYHLCYLCTTVLHISF